MLGVLAIGSETAAPAGTMEASRVLVVAGAEVRSTCVPGTDDSWVEPFLWPAVFSEPASGPFAFPAGLRMAPARAAALSDAGTRALGLVGVEAGVVGAGEGELEPESRCFLECDFDCGLALGSCGPLLLGLITGTAPSALEPGAPCAPVV